MARRNPKTDMSIGLGRELTQQLKAAGFGSVEATSYSRKDPTSAIWFIGWRKEPSWPDLEPWEMRIMAYVDGSKKGYVIVGRPSGAPSWTGHDRIEDVVTFTQKKTDKALAAHAIKRLGTEHAVQP